MNTECPGEAVLAQLVRGDLDGLQSQGLEEHLSSCPRCVTTLDEIWERDTIARTLQQGAQTDPEAPSEPLSRLVERLKRLRPGVEAGDSSDTDTTGLHTAAPADAAIATAGSDGGLPSKLGGYAIQAVLGSGGMGIVYRALDEQLHRPAALKVLAPAMAECPTARERFLREARAAAAVRHDHVVTVYQVGEDHGAPYLAMELLEGESLSARLKRERRLDSRDTVRIAREVASGLFAAHERGLVHRDIKPGNIWLEQPGGRVKLLDFGLASTAHADEQLTQTGTTPGTPAYMSPEQAQGKTVDHRSDLFSLGCVLYQACTGRLPFERTSSGAMLVAVIQQRPAAPSTIVPNVLADLSRVVMKLLEKDPGRRYQSAIELLAELDRCQVAVAVPGPRHQKTLLRKVAGALVIVLLAAGSAWYALLGSARPVGEPAVVPRRFVTWVLSQEGVVKVRADGVERVVRSGAQLPADGWQLTLLSLGTVSDATTITDEQLTELDKLRDLRSLYLQNTGITDRTLERMTELSQLDSLSLYNTQVTDVGLRHVARLSNLTRLEIGLTRVTDAGLEPLVDLPLLQRLYLKSTAVSDAGLVHLKKMTRLQELRVQGTQITAGGLAELKAALPGCSIQH